MTEIKLVIFDIDGTLTAGGVHLDSEGDEEKIFNVMDGLGFRLAECAGIHVAIISGRGSKAVTVRMAKLPADNVLLRVSDKRTAVLGLQSRLGISKDETAFVGDDLNDLPAFEKVGLKIAVANATSELKRHASYITSRAGGNGAVREAIEWLLKRQNRYEKAVREYYERELTNV